MTEVLSPAVEWVTRLADDERRRDDIRLKATQAAERQSDLICTHGRRMLEELRATVIRDVDAFRAEFPGQTDRTILLEADLPGGGFAVRKASAPTCSLSVAPNLPAGSVSCEYLFTSINGTPARRDHLQFVFASVTDGTLQLKQQGTSQLFATADALSEYLLLPVLTGRPR